MKTMRDRYYSDNEFHLLVDSMADQIERCKYTPSEMREAAILASILQAERNLRPMTFLEIDIEKALRLIESRVDRK